jgi:hypothetical protein
MHAQPVPAPMAQANYCAWGHQTGRVRNKWQAFPFFKPNWSKMEEYGREMGVEEVSCTARSCTYRRSYCICYSIRARQA